MRAQLSPRPLRPVLLVLAAMLAAFAGARADSAGFAVEFGRLIASEAPCGMAFDEAAIARVVEESVPADDLEFMSYLDAGIGAGARDLETMSAAARAAHCAQARRLAVHFGLVAAD